MDNFEQNVFLVIGAQHILQSDNCEFTASINTELKELWPELIIGDCRSRHLRSQGSVEISNFSLDTEQYKLGTRHGLLNSSFSRIQLMSSTFHDLSKAEIDSNTEISVRETCSESRGMGAQGFRRAHMMHEKVPTLGTTEYTIDETRRAKIQTKN